MTIDLSGWFQESSPETKESWLPGVGDLREAESDRTDDNSSKFTMANRS